MTMKIGFMMTSVGSIVVAIIQIKKERSHVTSYFAKTYPAVALAMMVKKVVTTVEINVFINKRGRCIVCQAYVELSTVGACWERCKGSLNNSEPGVKELKINHSKGNNPSKQTITKAIVSKIVAVLSCNFPRLYFWLVITLPPYSQL